MQIEKTESNKPGVWEKGGPSPNPNGRPKGTVSIVEAIRRRLLKEIPSGSNKEKRILLDKIVDVYFEKAIRDKDVTTLRDMIDRVDGKPLQKSDVTTGGEKLAELKINYITPDADTTDSD